MTRIILLLHLVLCSAACQFSYATARHVNADSMALTRQPLPKAPLVHVSTKEYMNRVNIISDAILCTAAVFDVLLRTRLVSECWGPYCAGKSHNETTDRGAIAASRGPRVSHGETLTFASPLESIDILGLGLDGVVIHSATAAAALASYGEFFIEHINIVLDPHRDDSNGHAQHRLLVPISEHHKQFGTPRDLSTALDRLGSTLNSCTSFCEYAREVNNSGGDALRVVAPDSGLLSQDGYAQLADIYNMLSVVDDEERRTIVVKNMTVRSDVLVGVATVLLRERESCEC
ncbi:uncharacterized protein V1518DRAFT_408909 [Limtongia smithiae]|uniref:uncharacterized protein n=1 Tax=Limtongia smithiae TaxID=1125753 RepID=UPI0034CEFD95